MNKDYLISKIDTIYATVSSMKVDGNNQDLAVAAKNDLKEMYNYLKVDHEYKIQNEKLEGGTTNE